MAAEKRISWEVESGKGLEQNPYTWAWSYFIAWSLKPGAKLGNCVHFYRHRVNKQEVSFSQRLRLPGSRCNVRQLTGASGQSEIKLKAARDGPYSLSRQPEVARPLTHWCLLKPFGGAGTGTIVLILPKLTPHSFPFHNPRGTLGGIAVIPQKRVHSLS